MKKPRERKNREKKKERQHRHQKEGLVTLVLRTPLVVVWKEKTGKRTPPCQKLTLGGTKKIVVQNRPDGQTKNKNTRPSPLFVSSPLSVLFPSTLSTRIAALVCSYPFADIESECAPFDRSYPLELPRSFFRSIGRTLPSGFISRLTSHVVNASLPIAPPHHYHLCPLHLRQPSQTTPTLPR